MDGGHRVAQHLLQDGQVDGVPDGDLSLLRLALTTQSKGRDQRTASETKKRKTAVYSTDAVNRGLHIHPSRALQVGCSGSVACAGYVQVQVPSALPGLV